MQSLEAKMNPDSHTAETFGLTFVNHLIAERGRAPYLDPNLNFLKGQSAPNYCLFGSITNIS